ncbi:DsbE family thiol:disulfide interchange protein [Histidinibacterium aquaticum]|uniref:DsbE family thiol:disulfide interchange protein n=1 Tax=Histidinibacterium aquaticum TaxID=2613962 RepID=A0A5J5GP15_9RHOB|nr:DsbE family thiol:disulfide interchange protein [Histidinibacterium aquaticum]KAA9009274.1 DsbE family thiol:disulfide interchange protein [Histidinibacterium aquaticum]
MARISPLVLLPPAIFAGIAGLFLGGMFRDRSDDLPSTRVGQEAPAITEEALPGYAAFEPEMLRSGEVTLVNFWASWCPPCRAEHPQLQALADEGIDIVGVNFRDQEDNALDYLGNEGNPFAAVPFDPRGRTAIDWGVTAPPETFIVDGDGTVLFRFAGPLVGSDYEQRFAPELEAALGEDPAAGGS